MSYRKWIHNCKVHDNSEVELSEEVCPECGKQGTFNGWGQSVIEMMSSYQRRYNLRALGAHRKMQDELFHGRMKKCDQCNGYGLIVSPDGDDRGSTCPKCNYGQYVFDGTPEEFESIRQKIIAVFPTADPAVPMPPKAETSSQPPQGYVGGGFFRPAENSLQAFKDLVIGLLRAINPNSKVDASSISDEKWEESYKRAMSKSRAKDQE